ADSFIEALATGANIGATSPILALRERLIDHKVKKERRSMEHIAFICMRAWLYYEAGLPLKRLPWRRQATEERPSEPFPYLADFPTDPKKLATLLKRGSAPKKVVKKATKKKATKKKAS
ncbi:MAG: hypothetical protein GTO63_02960, partial [Anaerolineae bacterium]|nr:hypothetical protein [Anaerolineae bacterium]NIQ77023.1 hypothetical protein [Anaerolineae bacterium]